MRGATAVLALLGDVARHLGQIEQARKLYEEGLEVTLALDARRQIKPL
jgi:hypothetical protein